jgi:hypothetical protein
LRAGAGVASGTGPEAGRVSVIRIPKT